MVGTPAALNFEEAERLKAEDVDKDERAADVESEGAEESHREPPRFSAPGPAVTTSPGRAGGDSERPSEPAANRLARLGAHACGRMDGLTAPEGSCELRWKLPRGGPILGYYPNKVRLLAA